MTERVQQMRAFFQSREYRKHRREKLDITELCTGKADDEVEYILLHTALTNEDPLIYENDLFGFNTCYRRPPENRNIYTTRWMTGNTTLDFAYVIGLGFDRILAIIAEKKPTADEAQTTFYTYLETMIADLLDFSDRYQKKAQEMGNEMLANALSRIPRSPAASLYEACLFQKLLIFALRATRHPHVTLGRFDQYMYPYYQADVARGMTREALLETVEIYFLSLNLDTDTYIGIQQGDNGQSMVLGGYDLDGNDQFNELSAICMDASLELEVIDPKINLRVSKKTADERYEYGTRLTKKGLGFPQYCNDDIVVPGLIALGYAPEDAVNYTVAACWEFIVPNCAVDIPNIQTFNFPLVINNAVHAGLEAAADFDALMQTVDQAIDAECARIIESCNTRETYARGRCIRKSPLFSLLTDGCLESGRDVSEFGAKYYNLGCHGAGIANAADALAAIKQVIYEDGSVTKAELLAALDKNFEGEAKLRNRLLSCPKVGNDDDRADSLMLHIMDRFSASLNGKPTGSGGVWRAGTGSAMEYILSAQNCPATADGRLASAPYGSSFSPAVTTKLQGPLSTVRSFTKPDLTKTINGGPLTLEIHDNVFRNEIGERKVAQLVKLFVHLGGHQLQLNAINKDILRDAQEHPENYPNLIVRVWGWSGYFCELDKVYQDHIISRTDFTV